MTQDQLIDRKKKVLQVFNDKGISYLALGGSHVISFSQLNDSLKQTLSVLLKNYLEQEIKELEEEKQSLWVSECCGAESRSNFDSDTQDIGICPDCGEHCIYVDALEDE